MIAICGVFFTSIAVTEERVSSTALIMRDLIGSWDDGSLDIVTEDGSIKFTWIDKYEGIIEAEGVCTVEGDSIRFTMTSGSEYGEKYFHQKTAYLYASDKNISAILVLIFDTNRRYWKKAEQPPGSERTYKGIPVVIINEIGYTNDNVRIRTGPSIEFDYASFWNFDTPHADYGTEYLLLRDGELYLYMREPPRKYRLASGIIIGF